MIFNILVSSLTFAIVITSGFYVLIKIKKDKNNRNEYKCFFLTEKGIRGRKNTKEDVLNMLNPIVEFINESEKSLDLCFYVITDYTVASAIINAKKRKVKIRLITDYHSGIVSNKLIGRFYKEGIPVFSKYNNPNLSIMHNKFCIRDDKTLLQGSMNLTRNTSKGNYESVMITDDLALVIPFNEYFEKFIEICKNDVQATK